MDISNQKKIGIIGGGVAGISSAVELLKNSHHHIHIFEAKNELGGRIFSFQDQITGEFIDNGKHLMVGAYSNFFNLLRFIDSYNNLSFQKHLEVNFLKKNIHYSLSSGRFNKISLLFSLIKINQLSISEKFRIINFIKKIKKIKKFENLNITASELLINHGQTFNIIQHIWEPLILATMNIKVQEASAAIFLEILDQAFFSSKSNQKIVFSEVPLMHLLKPIEKLNSNSFCISKYTYINKIERSDNNFVIHSSTGLSWEFDILILAISPKQIVQILPDSYRFLPEWKKIYEFTKIIEYSPILSVYLWSNKKLLNKTFTGLIDTEFQWIFSEKSNKYKYSLTKSAAEDFVTKSKKEIIEIVYKDLSLSLNEFNPEEIFHYQIIFEKQATIKITPEIEKLRPSNQVDECIFIAGDWTNTKLPATLESAAKSGFLAAKEIVSQHYKLI